VVNENRLAAGSPAGFDVSPSVSDNKTPSEVNMQVACRSHQHSRLRFAAVTAIRIVVVADSNVINPNLTAQEVVDLLDTLTGHTPAGDLRLVRDHDEKKTVAAQLFARLWDAGWNLNFAQSRWRVRPPIADQGPIQHPIPVQERSASHEANDYSELPQIWTRSPGMR
jgi:hypothetical protein